MASALQRLSGRILISSAMLAAMVAVPQPAAAGLFDVLFGRGPVYVVPVQPQVWPDARYDRPRKTFKVVKPRARISPDHGSRPSAAVRAPVKLTPAEEASHVAKFLGDHTLRRGDLIVTAKGPYVFNGAGGSRHRIADFIPAQNARNLDKQARAKVAEIARANRWAASMERTIVATPVVSRAMPVASNEAVRPKADTHRGAVVAQDLSR